MKYDWSDPHHAVWGFAKFLIVAIVLLVLLAANASKFDHTEITFWIQALAAIAGINGAGSLLKKRQEKCDHPEHQKGNDEPE